LGFWAIWLDHPSPDRANSLGISGPRGWIDSPVKPAILPSNEESKRRRAAADSHFGKNVG
jgi:hypothetical protein